ncbi:hypothetical protein [Rheinheimera sp.]|uniref:hypothetical protein n=1 Tax=Rheinheimera sp. TaxID=1869214 RepID=UPI00235582E9|nr:hypothetical protein [Rheinheimera sp.]
MLVGIGLKCYYSIQHLQAAAYLTRQASRIESCLSNEFNLELVALKAYVSSALFSSVAFLEALANEMYADAMQADGGHLSQLDQNSRKMIASLGETESVQKSAILTKFDLILTAAGKPTISRDCDPYQAVATVIRLRNEIVHYKAPFFDTGTENMVRTGNFNDSKLAKQIKGKFELRKNAQVLSGDSFLGHGLAEWSLQSSVKLADTIFSILNVDPYFDHVRENLGTKHITNDTAIDKPSDIN